MMTRKKLWRMRVIVGLECLGIYRSYKQLGQELGVSGGMIHLDRQAVVKRLQEAERRMRWNRYPSLTQ